MAEIVALGEPLVEFAAEQRGRLSTVRSFRRGWGGDTSNFAVAAARLGSSVGYITRLGDDEFGRSFLNLWRTEGVDASRVIIDPNGFTGVYFISLREDGGHDFTYYRAGSATTRLQPSDLDPAYFAGARVFHTSGISQGISESSRAAVESAIDLAKDRGALISYDVNFRPKLWAIPLARIAIEAAIARTDIVFLSTEDAGYLYGPTPAEGVVDRVLAGGPRLVVLKQGADGCLVASAEGERIPVPAWRVEAIDTTGAGDAFSAGFVNAWLRGLPLERAGRFANAVGALTASGLGAVTPIPNQSEVELFMSRMETGSYEKEE